VQNTLTRVKNLFSNQDVDFVLYLPKKDVFITNKNKFYYKGNKWYSKSYKNNDLDLMSKFSSLSVKPPTNPSKKKQPEGKYADIETMKKKFIVEFNKHKDSENSKYIQYYQ